MTVLLQIGPRPERTGPPGLAAEVKVFRSALGSHLFLADGSRVYDVPAEVADRLEARIAACRTPAGYAGYPAEDVALARELGLPLWGAPGGAAARYVGSAPAEPPALSALSLNVMQACNLSCGHCYADEGRFGGPARAMPVRTAFAAVDRLLAEAEPGADVVVGFMGGEPLLARRLVHRVVEYAAEAGRATGHRVRFAITTNLTTVRPEDAELFARHPFTVSVSLDGDRAGHDALRRARGGGSAYDMMRAGLRVLERHGRPRHLAARVSVTPRTTRLLDLLEHGIALGFDEVGFAAVVSAPDPALEITRDGFAAFLDAMLECGEKALAELTAGRPYPFGNFQTAMHQLHRGTHRPYPCGAGAGYLSASADGGLYACHRLVGDGAYAMGTVDGGPDHEARRAHLRRAHVDRMEPCRGCWARYLCGGGCYHEVASRGRTACGYIRGWLAFCLRAYVELSQARPEFFDQTPPADAGADPTTIAR